MSSIRFVLKFELELKTMREHYEFYQQHIFGRTVTAQIPQEARHYQFAQQIMNARKLKQDDNAQTI